MWAAYVDDMLHAGTQVFVEPIEKQRKRFNIKTQNEETCILLDQSLSLALIK